MSGYVDANIFLRLMTGDDPAKAARCFELFQRASQGEVRLHTSEAIVAEVVYVLSRSTYHVPRDDVAAALAPVLTIAGLRIDHKEAVLQALDLWQRSKLDFEDCLSLQHAQRLSLDGIYSYDRDFDQFPEILRYEP